jgi:serine/threonine-protein kinase
MRSGFSPVKLILYFLGFVSAGAIAVLLIFKIVNLEKTVEVPSLVGRSVSEATKILGDRGVFLEIQGEGYDAEISPGHIIRQDIKEGEKIKKGMGIRVLVSKGKAMFVIPYLEGMDIKDVKLTLERSGMEIGKITRVHSDTVDKNRVIAQRPLSGYSADNKVNLLVSLGPYDVFYRCPSFINMPVDEARKVAEALGLKLVEQGVGIDLRRDGSAVVFQKPEAGALVKKGDSIEVTLGRRGGLWF